jgi:hypothetical protein
MESQISRMSFACDMLVKNVASAMKSRFFISLFSVFLFSVEHWVYYLCKTQDILHYTLNTQH